MRWNVLRISDEGRIEAVRKYKCVKCGDEWVEPKSGSLVIVYRCRKNGCNGAALPVRAADGSAAKVSFGEYGTMMFEGEGSVPESSPTIYRCNKCGKEETRTMPALESYRHREMIVCEGRYEKVIDTLPPMPSIAEINEKLAPTSYVLHIGFVASYGALYIGDKHELSFSTQEDFLCWWQGFTKPKPKRRRFIVECDDWECTYSTHIERMKKVLMGWMGENCGVVVTEEEIK